MTLTIPKLFDSSFSLRNHSNIDFIHCYPTVSALSFFASMLGNQNGFVQKLDYFFQTHAAMPKDMACCCCCCC